MSYIQIEIGGKVRGLKFNQMADVEYSVKVGTSKNPIAHTYAMVWAGLIANCFVKGEEVDFTFEDVCEWCAGVKDEDFLKMLEVYKSTKAFLNDVPVVKKKIVKKKSVQKNTRQGVSKRR